METFTLDAELIYGVLMRRIRKAGEDISGLTADVEELEEKVQQLANALVNLGVTTTPLTDGATTNPIVINGESVLVPNNGFVIYDSKGYLFNGTIWQDFYDVSDYYSKSESDGKFLNAVEVTYAELVGLKTQSKLVPGRKYRITDYVTTTAQNDTQSAGNIFDIIVTADSANTLDENAEAIQHTDLGSDYFYGQKLSAWKLKYDIANDTQKYAWADSTNGKGVIYELEDEYGNKCGYDFKNIKMRFYQILSVKDSAYQDVYEHGFTDSYSISKNVGSTQYILSSRFNVGSNSEYRYTFDFYSSSTHYDYSLNKWNDNRVCCYGNVIKPLFGIFSNESLMGNTDTNGNKRYINFISFRNSIGNTAYLYGNIFGERNFNMSFLGMCYRNVFGNNCSSNIFAENAWDNHFGDKSMNNVVGTVVIDNIFDGLCTSKAMYNVSGNHYSVAASGTLEAKRLVKTEELGTAASANVGDFATAAQGLKADAALLKTGGAMSGDVTTTVTSFTNNSLVTRQFVEDAIANIIDYDEEAF